MLDFLQVPHHQGHLLALPRDPAGARGRPHQDGGEGRAEEQLQALPAGPEDRSEDPDSVEHQRGPADLPQGQGQIQGVGERYSLEVSQ